jgi:hypothetical protein
LIECHVEILLDRSQNLENLTQVTSIGRAFLHKSPFKILSHLPRAKHITFNICRGEDFINLQPFELLSLTTLKLKCPYLNWTLEELQAVFTFFPNLVELHLELRGFKNNFDEQVTQKKFSF